MLSTYDYLTNTNLVIMPKLGQAAKRCSQFCSCIISATSEICINKNFQDLSLGMHLKRRKEGGRDGEGRKERKA